MIIFQNEEGGLIGSGAISGMLTEKELDLVSRSGKTIREGIKFIGGDPAKIASVRRRPNSIAAYLELHIEQGGILDAEKIDIGVVEGIVGINWWDVTIEGFANHAGTTPMNNRQDALLAAAKFIEAVNRVVTSVPGRQVGTVGRIQALPGAPNVIPGKVVLSLELRDLDAAKILTLYQKIRAEADQIARTNKVTFDFKEINTNIPAPTDPSDSPPYRSIGERIGIDYQGDAQRRRSRRTGHGAPRAGRHDFHSECRRHQPLTERILATKGHREWRECFVGDVDEIG